MKVRTVHTYDSCGGGGKCPTIYKTEDGQYIIQGYQFQAADYQLASFPRGETGVIVPADFIDSFLERANK